ncbi:uncharacterized protein [Rutidosis leptorrhynchoides]|uniref:uncharacterized protein n=1 Tax=Rutidosis leptorrhynchoides TaxID=125765 RepID=UPI003A990B0D
MVYLNASDKLNEFVYQSKKEKDYAYLKIPLNDIMLATKNFAPAYCIRSHIDYMVYKADLNHLDIKTEGNSEGEFPKMCGPVTIRRNMSQNYEQVVKDFIADIKMLASRKHPNIVSLLGYSWEGYEMIRIFESCTLYKSLADHLRSIKEKTKLTWKRRIRICIDIAQGLDFFHENIEADGPIKLYQGLQSANVMLDEKWNAKIATFRFVYYTDDYIHGNYDQYQKDIYSFGVVLFEILFGRLANDPIYTKENKEGLAPIARRCFEDGTLKNMVDPNIMEAREDSYIIGPDQRSLDAYVNIAYQCLSISETWRPTLRHIINSLNTALTFQEKTSLEHMKIPLSYIKAATNNFTETCIGKGGYGVVYKAQLDVFDKMHRRKQKRTVAIKRIAGKKSELRNIGFVDELEIVHKCVHPNIISLLGFCFEDSENILVSEYAANGSLDEYLETGKLSKLPWDRRLKMCLDIAYALSYLHTPDRDKKCIIHRDIKSGNILLGENLEVKIADFGLSIFHPKNHPSSTINTEHCAGTHVYLDPEYQEGKLKIASDVYSFGVVLFEILSGKVAYDRIFTKENGNGIAPIARQRFKDGKLMEMVDTKIMKEAHELSSTIKIGPSQDSLDEFFEVACKCVAEVQAGRPKMKEVIDGLKKAIDFQKHRNDTLEISLEDIRLGGKTLSDTNCIIEEGYGMHNGEIQYNNETKPVTVKRMSKCGQKTPGNWREFEIPYKYKHEFVIGLIGYCKKMNEKFIVYEYAINQSLDMHVGNATLTWIKRLRIAIDIAKGLEFLHGRDGGQDVVIHKDLKSSNILLTGDWTTKICGFDRPLIFPKNMNIHYVNDVIRGYDIYSLGVILFELLCGRLASTDRDQFFDSFVKGQYEIERPDKLVFELIREQIVLESLVKFKKIAFRCLHDDRNIRPTAAMVLVQLKQALKLQEAGIWEAKLPTNYKQILEYSESPEIYSKMGKNDIYNKLFSGILLQEGKLWFSIGGNGERYEMISAQTFSYKNRRFRRWQTIQDSRFKKVAEMLDVSNLNIQIKRGPQLLLPNVNYSVHLVFKFCCPRKSHAKRMYVNLKYKLGNENSNSYFATWREDGWMMIELGRFLNNNDKTDIKVTLESFSRCYCDSRAIFIEGIEFRAVDDASLKVKQEIEVSDEIQQPILNSNSEITKFPGSEMASMRQTVHAMLLFKNYNDNDAKLLYSNGSFQCRLEGIEFLRKTTFSIKWKIGSQMVSHNTDNVCYLVFKLSENCSGLHCPVLVRDKYRWKSKETIYFRRPSPWNVHETDRIPKERRDGWMEVIAWIYDSNYKLRNDSLHVKLKFTTYEGTMSGLIIRGLEFRPMEG